MKKIKLLILGSILATLSSVAFADYLTPGKVQVYTWVNNVYMTGEFSVGHNPSNTNYSYVSAGVSNNVLYVQGTSTTTGELFYCYSYPSDPNFSTYRDMLNGAGNGSGITAMKVSGSTECSDIKVDKFSAWLQ